MTIGSFAMMLLATGNAIRPNPPVAGVLAPSDDSNRTIRDTGVPCRQTWRNVIIHTSIAETGDIQKRCHFVIDANGAIGRTDLWARQLDGNHVFIAGGDWNSDSIGVVVVIDPAGSRITPAQMASLQYLLTGLQRMFGIPDARVYRHGQLPGSPNIDCGVF